MNDLNLLPAILGELDKHICFIYENTESFLNTFSKGNAFDLIEVSFGGEHVRIVYILDSGQHIADSVKIADYLEWSRRIGKQPDPGDCEDIGPLALLKRLLATSEGRLRQLEQENAELKRWGGLRWPNHEAARQDGIAEGRKEGALLQNRDNFQLVAKALLLAHAPKCTHPAAIAQGNTCLWDDGKGCCVHGQKVGCRYWSVCECEACQVAKKLALVENKDGGQ